MLKILSKKSLSLKVISNFVVLLAIFSLFGMFSNFSAQAATTGTGFTQQLNLSGGALNLTQWKADIDQISLANLTAPWIRLPLNDIDVFPRTNLSSSNIDCTVSAPTNCNPTNLDQYDQAISYAKLKNIKVYLVTNVPSWAKLYSNAIQPWETKYNTTNYLNITKSYYQILATKWSAKVDMWQIFNEANKQTFDSYQPFTMSTSYMNLLKQVINAANQKIKSISGLEVVTTNAGGYPFNSALYTLWTNYFDILKIYLDQISVDIYPDTNTAEIANISPRIQSLITRYSKPVNVVETGMCTDVVRFNAVDQANYVPQYVQQSRNGGANLIFAYQYQDNDLLSSPCENTFGIVDSLGVQKSSYSTVINSLI